MASKLGDRMVLPVKRENGKLRFDSVNAPISEMAQRAVQEKATAEEIKTVDLNRRPALKEFLEGKEDV